MIDVADPTQPVEADFLDMPESATGVAVSGDRIYIVSGRLAIYRLVRAGISEATREPETPTCPAVSGSFADVWAAVRGEIGCASRSSITGLVAEENFEGGKMFWREPIDEAQALVLFDDGTWKIYEHAPYEEGSPEFPCADADTPAQCPPTPKRGFGAMWCDIPEIRNRLGNATDCERDYQGAMQAFERGFMLQTDRGTFYIFYDDGTWERR
jgi:hypothetical protein